MKPWGEGHGARALPWNCFEVCSLLGAPRLGKGELGPHTLGRTRAPPEVGGRRVPGAGQAVEARHTQQFACTLARGLEARPAAPNQCRRLSAN